ncbi:PDDEXK nuclease domain-containing protein [Solirubrobacter phytolaccae]|uniref:PDDEXK nuclease domain-containing protein n=1 Tax=Solirubrobacter phytolaccae TaxID=1404360 RepID=A0A9X3S895_9ACTN|nr:PDDEXK nuclease domain-containing protein [Solirubrobacter phytolaccae]MDA0181909.1 PDDEXK nuclease domain-containing protein [Solirubrobacter phytolaccae]
MGESVDSFAVSDDYRALIERLKQRVRAAQARAAQAVNSQLVMLYWSIGREILTQQQVSGWGDDVVGRISADLTADMGGARGFSRRNLFYMRRLATLWPDPEKVPPVVAHIGWSHNRLLLDAFTDQPDVYAWYAAKASEQRWSRRELEAQIHLRLHERQGAAVTNFAHALAPADADRALQTVKDPYVFDFLDLAESARERELEQALIDDIQRFLLELGSGFAFYGRQKALLVGEQEFFLDLLFYHHTLRRFVVIDLKVGRFEPEHVSKMNFYLNAVDEQLRVGDDRDSVGIILAAGRDDTVAKLSLHRVSAPIAVSTWQTDASAPDPHELAELEDVRARLVERITHHRSASTKPLG